MYIFYMCFLNKYNSKTKPSSSIGTVRKLCGKLRLYAYLEGLSSLKKKM